MAAVGAAKVTRILQASARKIPKAAIFRVCAFTKSRLKLLTLLRVGGWLVRLGGSDCPLQTATTSKCRYRWLRLQDLNLLRFYSS
jgi:hypothetical protein